MAADLIILGGPVLTIDPRRPRAEAIAVEGGRILAVGSIGEIARQAGPGTARMDLKGAALLPGLIEAHGHPFFSGLLWGDPVVDIRAVHTPTFEAALEKVRRRVAKAKPGEFLYFLGLDPQLHAGLRELDRDELDRIAPHNPLALQTASMHAVYLNSMAIAACKLQDDTPDPPGGKLFRDASGRLTGKLIENARAFVYAGFHDVLGPERLSRELGNWLWKFAAAGITTTSEIGMRDGWRSFLEAAAQSADMPVRVRGYEMLTPGRAIDIPLNNGDDRFAVIGMKMQADGSPFVGNIWVSRPYLTNDVTVTGMGLAPGHTGHMNYTRDQLQEIVDRAASAGWQVAIHVQGDRTFDVVLDCLESALARFPDARRPFRLEHCALISDAQLARAHKLGVVCSFFLPHHYYWGEAIRDNMFGPERASRYMPSGTATRLGMRVSYHCDAPMTWPDMLGCVQTAVTRRTRQGALIGESEIVDIDNALRAITIDAAHHLQMEDRVGSLEVGKLADLCILDADPTTHDPSKVRDIPVLATYLAGRPAFRSEAWVARESRQVAS